MAQPRAMKNLSIPSPLNYRLDIQGEVVSQTRIGFYLPNTTNAGITVLQC